MKFDQSQVNLYKKRESKNLLLISNVNYLNPNMGFVSEKFLMRFLIWSVVMWRFFAISSTFH